MEENEKETYFEGLSVLDSIKKHNGYKEKMSDIDHELRKMIRKEIMERVRFFYGEANTDNEMYVYLPLAVILKDQENLDKERYFRVIEVKDDIFIILKEWIWNEEHEESDEHPYRVFELEELKTLYRSLERMGFFDDKYKDNFEDEL